MENLNSLLKFWVWESGWKIDPATGVIRQSNMESSSSFGCLFSDFLNLKNTCVS